MDIKTDNNSTFSDCSHPYLELDIIEIKNECCHLNDTDSYSCDMCGSSHCYNLEKHYVIRCAECMKEAVLNDTEYSDLFGRFKIRTKVPVKN